MSGLVPGRRLQAWSLVELLVVVGVIGLFAALAIPMGNVFLPAQAQVANRNLNLLNSAVQCYNQTGNSELNTNVSEPVIMGILMTRYTNISGSPFLPSNLKTNTTSDSTTYRATWKGRLFQQLPPGTNGTGLNLLKLM